MNKNIAIGILVAVVVLGGGYYLVKNNASNTMDGYQDVTNAIPTTQTL